MASGTEALLIALMAIHLQPGDEVITTAFTFAATAEVIVLLGGWLLYNDAVGPSKLIGMAVTAAGLAFYARGVTKGSSSSTCGGRWVGRGVGRGVGGRAAALTAFL